jgi:hypothetical protein
MFVMSAAGRIERENDLDRSSGPRVFFVGGPFGNLARVGYDADDDVAMRISRSPPRSLSWRDPDVRPFLSKPCSSVRRSYPEVGVNRHF